MKGYNQNFIDNWADMDRHLLLAVALPAMSILSYGVFMGHPGFFLFYFNFFKKNVNFLQQIYVKNVQPVYGAGIRTHYIQEMSLLP